MVLVLQADGFHKLREFFLNSSCAACLWRGKGLNHVKFMLIGHFLNAKLNKQQYAYQKKLEQMEEKLSPSIHNFDYEPMNSGLSTE
ncbi:MAG: hypothetical protein CO150_07030 [Nitrospirae bacterium CG_4_9_14_3_um_filter_53_35]|nr:MAG: hypothetical protein AUK29_09075 [Nitrospirae bacterium CG2_30_53_67]PIS37444.1 MAG: hypothetical protein COT35_06005 [Nitrospirae bacterium CG08_land_8_20_14_0_20_52_24]PIV82530.1 MAG: hypothetical protein COW52_13010 [Nitrospirae bacterium CG17_big_fil_post_rev_8_21_14_2_50_50_9]PIW85626.1 MAG: hypothetical protein COZ95_03540 [Nitrospirae bacterium CG_4_8_14_3_um_filter_50_41]PIX85689.1 MAG: hypothetical protein COZ32_07205 [Nitrospirae bacterium CG_4_10_14_3_um_filter_53_41]PJA7418